MEDNYDVLYTTMLNADFETVKLLCLTNKLAIKTCSSVSFWKEKYEYNGFPKLFNEYEPKTVEDWKHEYEKVEGILRLIKKILNLAGTERNSRAYISISISFEADDSVIGFLPEEIIKNIDFDIEHDDSEKIIINYNMPINDFEIVYVITDSDNYERETVKGKINYGEAINILTWLLYHYPDYRVDIALYV